MSIRSFNIGGGDSFDMRKGSVASLLSLQPSSPLTVPRSIS